MTRDRVLAAVADGEALRCGGAVLIHTGYILDVGGVVTVRGADAGVLCVVLMRGVGA